MATATPGGSEGSLALFVTTIQLSIAAGSVLGGIAVSSSGYGLDFTIAAAFALVGAVVLLTLGRGGRTEDPGPADPAAAPLSEPRSAEPAVDALRP